MPIDKNIKILNGQTMTASEYYYGCTPDTWDNMLYWDAIEDRHERVREIYLWYLERELNGKVFDFDNQIRYHKVRKAVEDTKQLIDERTLVI